MPMHVHKRCMTCLHVRAADGTTACAPCGERRRWYGGRRAAAHQRPGDGGTRTRGRDAAGRRPACRGRRKSAPSRSEAANLGNMRPCQVGLDGSIAQRTVRHSKHCASPGSRNFERAAHRLMDVEALLRIVVLWAYASADRLVAGSASVRTQPLAQLDGHAAKAGHRQTIVTGSALRQPVTLRRCKACVERL